MRELCSSSARSFILAQRVSNTLSDCRMILTGASWTSIGNRVINYQRAVRVESIDVNLADSLAHMYANEDGQVHYSEVPTIAPNCTLPEDPAGSVANSFSHRCTSKLVKLPTTGNRGQAPKPGNTRGSFAKPAETATAQVNRGSKGEPQTKPKKIEQRSFAIPTRSGSTANATSTSHRRKPRKLQLRSDATKSGL